MARQNQVILIVGQRGSGKTDTTKNLLFPLQKTFPKIIVFDEFDSDVWHTFETWNNPDRISIPIPKITTEQFKVLKRGVARIIAEKEDLNEYFELFRTYARNTVLVLEDASRYLEGNLPPMLKRIVFDTKQTNVDSFMVFHSLADVPPKLARNCNFLILHKTADTSVPEKFKMKNVIEAFEFVNASENQFINRTIRIN